MEKTFILTYVVRHHTIPDEVRIVGGIVAKTNLEAIMKYFDGCPYTNRFEIVDCVAEV